MAKDAKVGENIPQEQSAQEQPKVEQPTPEQLMQELQTALSSGDYKAVATISRKIDQQQRAVEKAELDAKREAIKLTEEYVKGELFPVLKRMYDSGELDQADGVWLSWDFGDPEPSVRLMKTQTRTPRAGGGGTGKKFDISTEDMLNKHGEEDYKDGMTFRQAYDSNTDKNWRYAIRNKLLKLEGII